MTNEDILAFAARIHYARVDVGPNFSISYGRARWEQQLPLLSDWQREILVSLITHWETRAKKSSI